MEIKSKEDVKLVAAMMHDSEFEEGDFSYEPKEEKFFLETRPVRFLKKWGGVLEARSGRLPQRYRIEFYNVKKYTPINLNKIRTGKAITGVFDYIKIGNNGRKLTLISQDLRIELQLDKLQGNFEEIK